MAYFNSLSKKKEDKFGTLVALCFLAIFLVGKAVIESGHLLFYTVCLILGIIIYFFIEWINKNKQNKPASLGKIYSKKYPIIIQYFPPKGINPAEAGLLYNRSVEPTDLTSLIYQWKFENLIDIKTVRREHSSKEYVKLIKKSDMPLLRPLFETEIFNSIFAVSNVKIIEGSFQLRYALMLEDLEYHGIQKGWLTFEEKKGTKKFNKKFNPIGDMSGGILFSGIFCFLFIAFVFLEISNVLSGISISLTEFLWGLAITFCITMGAIMFYGKSDGRSKLIYTDKGAELASKVIGYSQFIKSCDENKINLFLKEDPLFIDRTLPYATAFGLETEFLKKISPLKKDWNAKYVRGQKVHDFGILRFFLRGGDDDSLF